MRGGVGARLGALLCLGALVVAAAAPVAASETAPPRRWEERLDTLLHGHDMGVSVSLDGTNLYSRRGRKQRVPASNQKLLMSMALFDELGPDARLLTQAAAADLKNGTVRGDLWLIGGGDPSVTGGGRFAGYLPYRPARLSRLARRLKAAGVTRITGSVRGDTSTFRRDWWAYGWQSHYPAQYAPLASALAFDGNRNDMGHIDNPEARAAAALTRALRSVGVRVRGTPGTGIVPGDVRRITAIRSARLVRLARSMNRHSWNFSAEMLGKALGFAAGRQGSIRGGADVVRRWADEHGADITAYDASGLSSANRISTRGLVRLLDVAAANPWGPQLRSTLPAGGQGTLAHRFGHTRLRAKTGTLPGHSALSGYVYLKRRERWASFSILSQNLDKDSAMAIEAQVVELLEERAS